jgi:predicted dehydrogenase
LQQVIQNIRNGKLEVAEIAAPLVRPGHVLIANECSLISAGTEKSIHELAQKSLLGKARDRPDAVRRVLEKLRTEGLLTTIRQVQAKLDEPMTMGYSSAGVVLACGAGVQDLKPGQRVASNGSHAGVVCVPRHLCACVPDAVASEQAAFAVLGSIALHGIRLAQLELGGTALVIGLGLIGQLAVSLLRAAGVKVIATDLDARKCELAVKRGAVAQTAFRPEDVAALTNDLGVDAVLITASTSSNQPIELASQAVRKKGRIVLVGVVGLQIDRRPFYFKECEFVVSCSYGPGRYDPEYEERGRDYPAAYVRWTEQRNLSAVLELMARGSLEVASLVSHRFPIERAQEAYRLIEEGKDEYLGVVLTYPEERQPSRVIALGQGRRNGDAGYACLGAGNFARLVLLPAIASVGKLHPAMLCSANGVSARSAGRKLGFDAVTTDEDEVFCNPAVQAVFILTRHDLHAEQVIKALRSGRHVFTEKPLCLTVEELLAIEKELLPLRDRVPLLMVGFNRRFSPAAIALREVFAEHAGPLTVSVRFNAGTIPAEHWTQDEGTGGGRIVGEACHAIDLATFLVGSSPVRVFAEAAARGKISDDQCFITLRHANGSISSVAYLAGGDRAFPKERVEVFGGGRVGVIDDYRAIETCVGGKVKRKSYLNADKGHVPEIAAFCQAVVGVRPAPMSWDEIRSVTLASILAVRSLREGIPFDVTLPA